MGKKDRKTKLVVPPKVKLLLTSKDGEQSAYAFSFYQAIWTGGDCLARYIAVCNTVGCEDVYGEGLGWDRAVADCLRKLVDKGAIEGSG